MEQRVQSSRRRYAGCVIICQRVELGKEETICSTFLDWQALPIHPTSIPNLEVVPSPIFLSNPDIELTTANDPREEQLKNTLHPIKDRYACICIACRLPFRGSPNRANGVHFERRVHRVLQAVRHPLSERGVFVEQERLFRQGIQLGVFRDLCQQFWTKVTGKLGIEVALFHLPL